MNIDVRKSSLVVGRRTRINILEGRKIRKDEYGGDCFEDYWTDSGEESSHTSVSSKRERSKKSTNTSLSEDESDLYDSDNDKLDKSKEAKKIPKKTFAKSAVSPKLEKCSISHIEENSLATTVDNSELSKLKKKGKISLSSKSVSNKSQDQRVYNQLLVKSKMNDSIVTRNMIKKQQDGGKKVKEILQKENSPLNEVNNFNKTSASFHNEAPPKSDKMPNTRNLRSKVSQFLNRVASEELTSSTSLSPLSKTCGKKRESSVSPHVVSKRLNYIKNFDLQEKSRMQILKDVDKEELLAMKSVSPLSKTFDVEKNTLLPNLVSKSVCTKTKSSVASPLKSPKENAALVKPLEKHQRKTKSALEMEKIISNCDEYDALIMQMVNENNKSSEGKNLVAEVDHSNCENILSITKRLGEECHSSDETGPQNEKTNEIDRIARKLDFTKTIKETSRSLLDQTKENSLGNMNENITSAEKILKETSKNVSSHEHQSKHNSRISSHKVKATKGKKNVCHSNGENTLSNEKRLDEEYHSSDDANETRLQNKKTKNSDGIVRKLDFTKTVKETSRNVLDQTRKNSSGNNIDENVSSAERILKEASKNVSSHEHHSKHNLRSSGYQVEATKGKKNSLLEVSHSNCENILSVTKRLDEEYHSSDDADKTGLQNKKIKNSDRSVKKLSFAKTVKETSRNLRDQTKENGLGNNIDENISSAERILKETSKNILSHVHHSVHNSRISSHQVASNASAKSIDVSKDIEDNDFKDNIDERVENNVQDTSSHLGQSSLMSISPEMEHTLHNSDHLSALKKNDIGRKKKHSSAKSKKAEDSNDAKRVRKSSRQRYTPLAHWRNERLLYRFESGQIKILGIDKGTTEDNFTIHQIQNQIPKGKKSKPPKNKKIRLHDTVYNRKVRVNLYKPFLSVEWMNPDNAPDPCPYRIKRTIETENSAFGFLEIDIAESKPPQYMPEEDLQMTLLKGRIKVIIQEDSFDASEKDMFIVPRGSAYTIKNIGNTKACLLFGVGKFKYLESQR